MAGLDDLFAQIPVQDIANKLGADQGQVNNAIQTLVPALVGGLAPGLGEDLKPEFQIFSAVPDHKRAVPAGRGGRGEYFL